MKTKLKKMTIALASLLTLVSGLPSVSADTNVQKVIDESYVQPDYVLGYSLDDLQVEQTLGLLNYDSEKDKKEWKT